MRANLRSVLTLNCQTSCEYKFQNIAARSPFRTLCSSPQPARSYTPQTSDSALVSEGHLSSVHVLNTSVTRATSVTHKHGCEYTSAETCTNNVRINSPADAATDKICAMSYVGLTSFTLTNPLAYWCPIEAKRLLRCRLWQSRWSLADCLVQARRCRNETRWSAPVNTFMHACSDAGF